LAPLETVNPSIPSTVDAAILSKMADRKQFHGRVIVDGPLALDNAISIEAAEHKGIQSIVAGKADILVVPDLNAGNILHKSLVFFANKVVAGIVMGAKVPVIMTSRSDSLESKLASLGLAISAHHNISNIKEEKKEVQLQTV
jgi:phosphate butyryltransferase